MPLTATVSVSPAASVAVPESKGVGLLVSSGAAVGITGTVVSTTNSRAVASDEVLPAISVTVVMTS